MFRHNKTTNLRAYFVEFRLGSAKVSNTINELVDFSIVVLGNSGVIKKLPIYVGKAIFRPYFACG